jgi:hypothetical protein
MDSKEVILDGGSYEPPLKHRGYTEYERLRTILDSLQIGALRYYLEDADAAERTARFEKMSKQLVPICDQFWGREQLALSVGSTRGTCPPGYNDCDGVCVPYSC